MGLFHQTQGFHLYAEASDYRFPILTSIEFELLRVYDLWEHCVLSEFKNGYPGWIPEYQSWLDEDLVDGPMDEEGAASEEDEPMEDSGEEHVKLTEDELYIGLTEALTEDAVPASPTSSVALLADLESCV